MHIKLPWMKMDISYWNNYNPGIKFHDTTKQYYGKYLWRLVIHAEAGRLLVDLKHSLEEALEHRRVVSKSYNYAGSWWNNRNSNLDKVDLPLLRSVQDIKTKFENDMRMRVEEPNIQFYTEDEATLKSIADMLDSKLCIESVSGPKNAATEKLLREGVILRKGDVGYDYKVVLRDGRYGPDTKQQLLNYFDNLGDEIKLSKTCREMLTKTYPSMWGVYFYTNDPKLLTFINLIDTKLVSNIHRVINNVQ